MKRVTLRDSGNRENEREFSFHLFCQLDHVASLFEIDKRLAETQFETRRRQYRAKFPGAKTLIISCDGADVGQLEIDRSRPAWHLIDIAIFPGYRNRGIGQAVVKKILNEADQASSPVHASVFSQNVGAQRFWERMGFTVLEKRDDYWSLSYSGDSGRDSA